MAFMEASGMGCQPALLRYVCFSAMGKSDFNGNSAPLLEAAAKAGAIFEAAASIPALANSSRRCNIIYALPCGNLVPTISESPRPLAGPALDDHFLVGIEFHCIAALPVQHAE